MLVCLVSRLRLVGDGFGLICAVCYEFWLVACYLVVYLRSCCYQASVALAGLLFMFIFKGCLFSVCIWIGVWVGWYAVVVYFPILLGLMLVLGFVIDYVWFLRLW